MGQENRGRLSTPKMDGCPTDTSKNLRNLASLPIRALAVIGNYSHLVFFENPIDKSPVFLHHLSNFSHRTRFTPPFFEDLMKWAYLKMPHRCLPEADA